MGTAEDLFEGQPTGMPEPMPRRTALYREGSGPAVVRHLEGYGPFVEFCEAQGVRAEELAADPERLIRFLRTAGSQFADDSTLRAPAAVFVGNTIVGLRPDAKWTAYEGAPSSVGNREKAFEVDRLLEALRSADDDAVRGLISVLDRPASPFSPAAVSPAPPPREQPCCSPSHWCRPRSCCRRRRPRPPKSPCPSWRSSMRPAP